MVALAAFALARLVAPPLAAAQPSVLALPSVVRLQLTPCGSAKYDATELAELLRLELRGLGVERLDVEPSGAGSESHAPGDLALIHLGCGPVRAALTIELADLVGGNRVSREVLVDGVPANGRTRALSHAIAQLLEGSWSLLATRADAADGGPAPMPPSVRAALRRRLRADLTRIAVSDTSPSGAASEGHPTERPQPPVPELAFRTALLGRAFPAHGSGVFGVAISAAPRLPALFELAFELEAMYGRQGLQDTSGAIDALETLWLGAGATLFFAAPTEPRFQLGPTLRAAYVHVLTSGDTRRSTPRDPGGWIAMLGASSLVHFDLTPEWDLFFGADIAYAPGGLRLRADATRAVGFGDLALALRLGVSWNR